MNRVRNQLIIHETLEPGSWSQYVSNFWKTFLSMNLSVAAIARVDTGSLTPTLSRRERVSRPVLGDMPVPRSSEPSRPVPATTRLGPPKPAAHVLLLPPGEGRDEGRSLQPSRPGSWPVSRSVSNRGLSMNIPSPRHRHRNPNRNPPASSPHPPPNISRHTTTAATTPAASAINPAHTA